ncbi:hypothetical protein [Neisseria sp. HMSC077D05]|nr:hypothetical protein [Neisseria sp. HMSC077D05]
MTANKSLKTFINQTNKKDETNRLNANHTGSLTFLHHPGNEIADAGGQ